MAPEDVLDALDDAVRALGAKQDLGQLLEEVLRRGQALVGYEHGVFFFLEPERGDLAASRAIGYGERLPRILSMRLAPGQGLTGWAAQHRQAVRCGDVRSDPRYLQGLPEARSNLVVPLLVDDEVVGVVSVESSRTDAFDEKDERLLRVLGTYAALVLVGHRNGDRLQQRLAQLQALYRISRIASEREDLDSVLDAMLDVTQELLPGCYVAILLVDHQKRVLRVRAERGYMEEATHIEIPIGKGVTGRCAQSGQIFTIDDVAREADYIPGIPEARSEIAVPLVAEGRVIGVLNAESRRTSAFGADHARALSVIAQQAAVVLRSAQLYEETRRLAITDPLTGLYNRRHFLGHLEETLRRARRYRENFAVALLDVDGLKAINDRLGHGAGDRALESVGQALREWVRDTDMVARVGGDEFAALLLQVDGPHAAVTIERLRDSVRQKTLREGDESLQLTVSGGLALYPAHGGDSEALLARADAALYAAKNLGRDRIVIS
jgi:diguanylate cyclase (GGDEF)-like protein